MTCSSAGRMAAPGAASQGPVGEFPDLILSYSVVWVLAFTVDHSGASAS